MQQYDSEQTSYKQDSIQQQYIQQKPQMEDRGF